MSYFLTDLTDSTSCVGVARVGSPTQVIAHDDLRAIHKWDLGGPLQSLVVVGNTHPLEEKMLALIKNAQPALQEDREGTSP